jgi:hypothetical protein
VRLPNGLKDSPSILHIMTLIRVYLKGKGEGNQMLDMHETVGARPSAGGDPRTGESFWWYQLEGPVNLEKLESELSKYPFFDRIEEGEI